MFYKREVINVQVSRRILWVGAAAYPLHNIACVTTTELKPRLWLILKRVGPWGFAVCAVFMGMVLYSTGGSVALVTLVGPPVLAGVAVLVISLLVRLTMAVTRSTLHRLNIETAGAPYAVLTSPDKNLVAQISHSIMDAIDNPQAEFQFQVENFHVGDSIKQFGNQNTGKVTR
ncbi:hypothetical protein OEIGOIKO_07297 [Streptomyces chrestomyceticus JCM 4735]|uniref:Uncharacterized protein n=1 Tax=Streptomyces chrestomyceticus JCM 4735 TaxID=1306181 RepID=A0A7U9L1S9_9ACTN|nr:hypothetical protein OEIGOIKO_07297 [Streptomyces chrestomyceticus JCM 4735]